LISDANGKLLEYNQRWYDYTGLSHEQTFADSGFSAVHPDDRERIFKYAEQTRRTHEPFICEYRLRRHDGIYRWMLCRLIKVDNANENGIKGFGTITDIDDQKQMQFALERERVMRDEFVSMLTHDLRNPMSAVKMSAEMLMKNSVITDERFIHYPLRISKNINRANEMIINLLDASRIKAGEMLTMKKENIDLVLLIKENLIDLTMIHGDRFIFNHSTSEINGSWNAEGIRRILDNLCNNAVKFGEDRTFITISILKSDKNVVISVHNSGNPIPLEEQDKLFEIYQKRATQSDAKPGWGLGLTLVKGIAKAHGGDVILESTEQTGTTFKVVLPI
jgi:PAS domain S-box-containing protein